MGRQHEAIFHPNEANSSVFQFLSSVFDIKLQSQESEGDKFAETAKELKTQDFHTLDTDMFLDLD